VGTGKVEKLNLSFGKESLERSWQLPLSRLTPGIYRVDIWIADSVAWRQYFNSIRSTSLAFPSVLQNGTNSRYYRLGTSSLTIA
jgi:hypothetical protein